MKNIFDNYIDKNARGFLKLDNEGSEYQILDQILALKDKLTGVAIEFHSVPENIDIINKFISEIKMDIVGFNINDTGFKYKSNPKYNRIVIYQ